MFDPAVVSCIVLDIFLLHGFSNKWHASSSKVPLPALQWLLLSFFKEAHEVEVSASRSILFLANTTYCEISTITAASSLGIDNVDTSVCR